MTLAPNSVEALQEAVRSHDAVAVRGGGTKSPRAGQNDTRLALEMRQLSGITEYSPDECVFTALAGTPLAVINQTLAEHGQYLPFDPPFAAAGATIGGTMATGLSGSGRYRYGGVRDFVIGARIVDGEGRLIRSGGKVVKNAAGFLLHHGMVGSLGRFGVLTEVTFKVFPSPEARGTLRVDCGSLANALATLRAIETARFDLEAIDFDASGTMWIRVAGCAEALAARMANLRRAVPQPAEALEDEQDRQLWTDASEFTWVSNDASLVKVPMTPARAPEAAAGLPSTSLGASPSTHSASSGSTVSGAEPSTALGARKPGPPFVRRILFTCAGRAAWIACAGDLTDLSRHLLEARLQGLVVRGPHAGMRIGLVEPNTFEERVRSVLDPLNRFNAAQHPRS